MTKKNNEADALFKVMSELIIAFIWAVWMISRFIVSVSILGAKKCLRKDWKINYVLKVIFWFFVFLNTVLLLKLFDVLPKNWEHRLQSIAMSYPLECLGGIVAFVGLSVWFFSGLTPFYEKKMVQAALDDLGFATKTGKNPQVVSITDKGDYKKNVLVKSVGIGTKMYKEKLDNLQSSVKWIIDDIQRLEDSSLIMIKMTEKALPKKLNYSEIVEKITKPYQIILGRSLSGFVLVTLEELPHLLVAGVTGGGKSNLLNVILMSLLTKSKRLQIHCIDLKVVELNPYKKFPQVKVSGTLIDALETLKSVQNEMNRRYGSVLVKSGHRKIDPVRDKLDRILVMMDECSDILAKAQRSSKDYKTIEECKEITNTLARKGRAAGIHLILATQRASKDMLDSRIVGNMSSKVCFRMASVPNSVHVLNSKDAYDLPKIPGRAYWSDGNDLEEIQVPYITEGEVTREAEIAHFDRPKKESTQTEEDENSTPLYREQRGRL